MQDNNLPSDQLVQAISAVEMTSSVDTLETLFLGGNSIEGEASWESIATLINKANNLAELYIRDQLQEREIKIQVQVAEPLPKRGPTENPFFKGSAF